MKGENRFKILEFLEGSAQAVGDLFFIFTLPYGTSFTRMKYLVDKRHLKARSPKFKNDKRRFDDLLYRLRKDGLVEGKKRGGKQFLKLSLKGRIYLDKFRFQRKNNLPNNKYQPEKENVFKIVIFDIPEKEARKRKWLRAALKNLEFKMLQKSVWAGKAKLPKEFIYDLDRLHLDDCVEIFAISRFGSLSQLKIET